MKVYTYLISVYYCERFGKIKISDHTFMYYNHTVTLGINMYAQKRFTCRHTNVFLCLHNTFI